mmetsp:Transcript_3025/g.7139  ORF Transcript_3025/g.7139 Transcript_3025/m.7139 type:complete len:206 (+) Transcript_3025:120-737(+)
MELEAGSQGTVYRVSYDEEHVGKMVKKSKTKVTWKFVVAGRKHVIQLNWSKSTGKQEIFLDGASIWFGRNKGRSVLDHHWTTPDESLNLHVLATCAPKLTKDFRSYDLLINGLIFASLPCDDDNNNEDCDTEQPWVAHPDQHDMKKHPKSILQILYPEGYSPPTVTKSHEIQETTAHAYPVSIVPAMPANNNDVLAQPPIADLLA